MRTALYESHLTAEAKMVDFSGWEMPLHYGSQINEHHVVRQSAGMFDVSHMGVVDIHGENAEQTLRRLMANDVAKLNDGQALYTCMLNHEGGVIDDLIAYRLSTHSYRLVINAGRRKEDIDWIQQQILFHPGTELTIHQDMSIIAIQGPQALERIRPLFGDKIQTLKPFRFFVSENTMIARTGYTGESGVEVILPAKDAAALWQQCLNAGILPCGLGARDTLRLEAGYNLYGHDMDESTSPAISGLNWTVDLSDPARDFIGKSQYLQHKQDSDRQFIGVIMTERGVLRDDQPIYSQGSVVGAITSGGFSPTLGCAIGLARIQQDKDKSTLSIERRGKHIPLQTIALPFVKQGKKTF